jgi:hypothetical protein
MNKEYIKKLEETLERIEKVLGNFHNRIKALEQPKPKCERKIIFDYFVAEHGETYTTMLDPTDFDQVTGIYRIGVNTFLFSAKDKSVEYPLIFIGHYE